MEFPLAFVIKASILIASDGFIGFGEATSGSITAVAVSVKFRASVLVELSVVPSLTVLLVVPLTSIVTAVDEFFGLRPLLFPLVVIVVLLFDPFLFRFKEEEEEDSKGSKTTSLFFKTSLAGSSDTSTSSNCP